MMSSEVSSAAAMKEVEVQVEVEEEEELELGLSLGANNSSNSSRKQYCCRILTAKDFPAAASPMSPSSSVSSSGIDRAPLTPSHQVVGWPPIRAFRMNSLVTQSKDNTSHNADTPHLKKSNHNHSLGVCNESVGIKNHDKKRGGHALHATASRFVKVNKDGDPIGRKVDLGAHASYETLAIALELMFRKPTAVLVSPSENSMKASKLLDGSSEFVLTYEDKDGDWMLVGDVPYRMFLDTVKRLRIMRTSDSNGLAPRFQSSTGVS